VVRQVVKHPGAVVIVPQLEDSRLVLIEQYRFAVGETLLEFPAGTLEPDEAPLECARRELIEETGYRADHWHALGVIYPSPGYCDEQQHLFVASGLVPDQAAGDEDEILEVKRLTVQEVERAIADGTLIDAKSIAACPCEAAGGSRGDVGLDPRGGLLGRRWGTPVHYSAAGCSLVIASCRAESRRGDGQPSAGEASS
jgi:ADP-ribose pyrophosphatase